MNASRETATVDLHTRAPLTCQQQWLWELLQIHRDWGCVVSYGFALRGRLYGALLERSLERIVRRHESLRTRLVVVEGAVVQEIAAPAVFALECETVPGLSKEETDSNAREMFVAFSQVPVNALSDSLFRVLLLKLNEREHWLLLAAHRLVADCFSVDQLIPELWALYAEGLQGSGPTLFSRTPQYRDYAIWQHDGREQWASRHQEYWRKRLNGAQNIQWPPDRPCGGASAGSLGRMNIRFGEALSEELREFARNRRTLAANVMLALYVTALWRHCEQTDFVVPCFVAGRQSEHKAVVGYFSHILYVRVQLAGTETFSDLVRHVGNEFFRALSHQDFGRMAIEAPQLLSGTFFQWLTWPTEKPYTVPSSAGPDGAGLVVERLSVAEFAEYLTAIPPGRVDVELTFFDTAGGIYASGVYRADRFTQATMDRFMAHLRSTAEACLRSPDVSVSLSPVG